MGALRHALRAYPTLLRVGLAEVLAYRAEFLVWILTTNMPLVMLALWNAVAADGPVGRFGQREFVAYYLAMLVVRLLTGSWVVWQLTMEIREGHLAPRLLRPLHPLVAYSAEHLAAIPFRILVVLPVIVALFVAAGDTLSIRDGASVAVFFLSLAGGWLLMFFTMVLIGSLALFVDSAAGLFELWFGAHMILSGYLIPIDLMPRWVGQIARLLPFWYMQGLPVETLLGMRAPVERLIDLGIQWGYAGLLLAVALLVWRAGMRRFVAFGG